MELAEQNRVDNEIRPIRKRLSRPQPVTVETQTEDEMTINLPEPNPTVLEKDELDTTTSRGPKIGLRVDGRNRVAVNAGWADGVQTMGDVSPFEGRTVLEVVRDAKKFGRPLEGKVSRVTDDVLYLDPILDDDGRELYTGRFAIALPVVNSGFTVNRAAKSAGTKLRFVITSVEYHVQTKAPIGAIANRAQLILKEQEEPQKVTMKVGDIVEGTITKVFPYGAVLDLGRGLRAMINRADICFDMVFDAHDRLRVGQLVKGVIERINENGKMYVSAKALMEDPWGWIPDKYKHRMVVHGTTLTTRTFDQRIGVFVRLEPGVEAMIVQARRIPVPGTSVAVSILRVDPEKRHITCRILSELEG